MEVECVFETRKRHSLKKEKDPKKGKEISTLFFVCLLVIAMGHSGPRHRSEGLKAWLYESRRVK